MAFVSSVSNVIVESLSNTTNKNNMRELLRRVAVRDATGVLLVVVVVVELKFIISPAKIESLPPNWTLSGRRFSYPAI
jgi:hypothetical protein